MVRVLVLLVALLVMTAAGRAEAQATTPCDCAKCLVVQQIKAEVAQRLYRQALESAQRAIAWSQTSWARDPALARLWEMQGFTPEERLDQLARRMVRAAHEAIGEAFDAINRSFPHCVPELEGRPVFMLVDTQSCTIPRVLRLDATLGAPCPAVYMTMLAHELVHIEHCEAIVPHRRFTGLELLRTEVEATRREGEVAAALYQRLMRQGSCTPTSYSPKLGNADEALELLRQAEDYDRKYWDDEDKN